MTMLSNTPDSVEVNMRRMHKRQTRSTVSRQHSRARAQALVAPPDLWTALVEGWRAFLGMLRG